MLRRTRKRGVAALFKGRFLYLDILARLLLSTPLEPSMRHFQNLFSTTAERPCMTHVAVRQLVLLLISL